MNKVKVTTPLLALALALAVPSAMAETPATAQQVKTDSGPTFGLSPFGIGAGKNVGGLMASIHAGWRVRDSFAIELMSEAIIRPTGGNSSSDNNPKDNSLVSDSIIGISVTWWPSDSIWSSATIGWGDASGSERDGQGPAAILRLGRRLTQHTSLFASGRTGHYDGFRASAGLGLEFSWGAPRPLI